MSTIVMHNVVSVDGYIADGNDDVNLLEDPHVVIRATGCCTCATASAAEVGPPGAARSRARPITKTNRLATVRSRASG